MTDTETGFRDIDLHADMAYLTEVFSSVDGGIALANFNRFMQHAKKKAVTDKAAIELVKLTHRFAKLVKATQPAAEISDGTGGSG